MAIFNERDSIGVSTWVGVFHEIVDGYFAHGIIWSINWINRFSTKIADSQLTYCIDAPILKRDSDAVLDTNGPPSSTLTHVILFLSSTTFNPVMS